MQRREVQPGVAIELDPLDQRQGAGAGIHGAAFAVGIDEGVHSDLGQDAGALGSAFAQHVEENTGGDVPGGQVFGQDPLPDQRRIGIARAIYGRPRVVVLDEPNANLDLAGEAALTTTLLQLQRDRCTVILVTHRTNVLQAVDRIAMIVGGKVALYGPREEVLAKLQSPAAPLRPAGAASLPHAMPAVSGPAS